MLAANAVRADLAVADRRERLDAEEERLAEPSAEHRARRRPAARPAPHATIRDGEDQVEHRGREAPTRPKKPRPRNRQQLVVRREALENAEARSARR